HAFSSGAGGTTDGDGSHGSTSKTPSYTKSVSWHHYRIVRQERDRQKESDAFLSGDASTEWIHPE
ncbi:hypothetical protein, partial [Enterobacter roggenkampii]|uniref:hypothetical protein n=1 Tax=Enterobacter roggenkampii TaxID=1812935 RepID=UPI0035236742